jgi:uncharacterized protein YdcH (DUF465 family)
MDMTAENSLKEELMKQNQNFRDLVTQHQKYEERLNHLSGLNYPSEDEQLEESNLKKKKLAVKDEIYAMISEYASVEKSH